MRDFSYLLLEKIQEKKEQDERDRIAREEMEKQARRDAREAKRDARRAARRAERIAAGEDPEAVDEDSSFMRDEEWTGGLLCIIHPHSRGKARICNLSSICVFGDIF